MGVKQVNKITAEEVKQLLDRPVNIFDEEVKATFLKGELPLFKEAPRIAALCIEQAEEIERLRAENERLRGALEPLAIIGRLTTVRRHSDAGLWAQSSNEDSEVIRLMSSDAINAAEALAQSPTPAKEDKTNGGWLPIECAPKDGTEVLITDGRDVCTAMYSISNCVQDAPYFATTANGEFYNIGSYYRTELEYNPAKYWQPLPQPPINDKQ